MKQNINVIVKIPRELFDLIDADLDRTHIHATERVGFITTKSQMLSSTECLILMTGYNPVQDDHYIKDHSVGAHIDSDAIIIAMQRIMTNKCGQFHVHKHWGDGVPDFSPTDMRGLSPVMKSFQVDSLEPHGLFLINADSFNCLVWLPGNEDPVYADQISIIGYPLKQVYPKVHSIPEMPEKLDRQSFLGEDSHWFLNKIKIGIVGLGGGGSHVMQQAAHVGIGNIILFDPDYVEKTNLNRMVGASELDAKNKTPKVSTAERLIKAVNPDANVIPIEDKWQNHSLELHKCDIVFGCIDSLVGRRDLEAECRKYLIPYIDVGMDVYQYNNERPAVRGQIILSMPGDLCCTCYGFLSEENLAEEVGKYGDAGGLPQVIWSNGVLSSTAIGIAVDLITGWSGQKSRRVYLSYNGNTNIVIPHINGDFPSNRKCIHFPFNNVGPTIWGKPKKNKL